jgi:hypothetical protein
LSIELEYTIGRVFQNIQDWDYYGIIMEPTTAGVPVDAERGADGLKRIRFEPDYTCPNLVPFNIPPANSGTLPWRGTEIGLKLFDRISNQPTELMKGGAPGRVDSSSGLGFLYEVSGVPLSPTANNIAIGVSGCYKSLLGLVKGIWGDEKLIEVSQLDDALAGIKFDSATGEMNLAENALPHPDELEVTIRSKVPESPQQQKLELMEALKAQIITPTEYRIQARKKGLSLPVGSDHEWENYRRAMLENLVLFADGKTSGQIIFSPRDLHPIHLMVLDIFMARPEFYLATPEVRDEFVKHHEAHEAGMGILPDDMEYPEGACPVRCRGNNH